MTFKRGREEGETCRMANTLVLMSLGSHESPSPAERVFECKTCNRRFHSFQALGGHRASHKRVKLSYEHSPDGAPASPKVHKCSICRTQFPMGQALGGHMRRHRAEMEALSNGKRLKEPTKRFYLDLNFPPSDTIDEDFAGLGFERTVQYLVH